MVRFLRELFCRHKWEHWYIDTYTGELWSYRVYKCKKCGKIAGQDET